MSASAVSWIFHLLLSLSAALIIVLSLRYPVRALFGAKAAYACWSLVPVVLAVIVVSSLLPLREVLPQLDLTAWAIAAPPLEPVRTVTSDFSNELMFIWFVGAAVFGIVQFGRQRAFVQSLGMLESVGGGAWVAEARSISPAVLGVLHPQVVLPADFLERYSALEQELVLAHEQSHVERLDPLANLVVALMRTVFWFHPLVHLASRALHMDQELACDASVVAARPTCRTIYAQTLLRTHLVDRMTSTSCHWESETARSLNRRFVMLKNSLPTRVRRIAGAVVVTLAALVAGGATWAAQPIASSQSLSTLAGVDLAGTQTLQDIADRCQRAANPPVLTIDGQPAAATSMDLKRVMLGDIERIEVRPAGADTPNGAINVVLRK